MSEHKEHGKMGSRGVTRPMAEHAMHDGGHDHQGEHEKQGNGDEHGDHGGHEMSRDELSAVDAQLDGGKLQYNDYPNALERIAHSFERRYSGDLWVTARPGYEFCLPKTKVHNSGSHGSLHRSDSTAPLIVSSREQSLPNDEARIVDVAPLCMALLGETPLTSVGQSHRPVSVPAESQ